MYKAELGCNATQSRWTRNKSKKEVTVSVSQLSMALVAVDTVVSGILHDVVDDTCESLDSIEREFGDDVAKLVAGVSRLSYVNQLLRRHQRVNMSHGTLVHEEANNLRVMLLGMVDDPHVVLISLLIVCLT
ncbi:hypothetical protein RHMOL_Rhmol02G0096700 [Rhododendron molle]|uniref:Uncharacterized protein n=1 Tax=Rhododendron molle TaxID=49168 RepID=A0ACC0PNF1_RHOML|nr:hypothetical protein RHMOL_Rhmol02G0096700 [Rhododendron molle]